MYYCVWLLSVSFARTASELGPWLGPGRRQSNSPNEKDELPYTVQYRPSRTRQARARCRAGPKLDQSNTNSPLDLVCFQAVRTLSPSRRVQWRCRVQPLVRARHTASSSRNPLHCHRIRPGLCVLRRHASQACNSAQSSMRSHPHAPFSRKDGSSSHTAVHSGSSEARFASPVAFF